MDKRIPAWTFLLLGIALFVCGLYASQRTSLSFLDKITGHHISYAKWYLIGGILCIVLGLIIRFRKTQRR